MKDPTNNDEALDKIVRYCESCQSGQYQRVNSSKAFKAQAAHINDIPSSDGDSDSDEGGEPNQVARANFKLKADNLKLLVKLAVQTHPKAKRVPEWVSSCKCPVAQMRRIIVAETEKCLNNIKICLLNKV